MDEIEQQLAKLSEIIESGKADSDTYFNRGRLFWKLQKYGQAISDYENAVAIDPESPAAQALEMSRQVMDFYHKDRFNP